MSSPIDNDRDEKSMYMPPWARETPHDPFDTVQATVERLRRERRQHPPVPDRLSASEPAVPQERPALIDALEEAARLRSHRQPPDADMPPRALPVDVGDIETAMGDIVRETWRPSSLDPVTMPPPPKQSVSGPTWGMVARLGGAVGFAAGIALFVVGAIPVPSITNPFANDRDANAASMVRAVSFKTAAQPAVAMVSAPPEQPVIPAFAPTTVGIATIGPPIIQQDMLQQPVAPPPAHAPKAAEVPRPTLAPDEIALLLKRGQDLVSQGDIAGGRLLLTRAADAGDAQAALTLAGTYDSLVLARQRVIGVLPDNARAKTWYVKAAAMGSVEAARRLEQYAHRAD